MLTSGSNYSSPKSFVKILYLFLPFVSLAFLAVRFLIYIFHDSFRIAIDQLVATSHLKIDRPKGTLHPRYPSFVYPLDYGYLQNTRSGDGNDIDVWIGSLSSQTVTAVICNVDLEKRDIEIKILLGCTSEESQVILEIHNTGSQSAILLVRN